MCWAIAQADSARLMVSSGRVLACRTVRCLQAPRWRVRTTERRFARRLKGIDHESEKRRVPDRPNSTLPARAAQAKINPPGTAGPGGFWGLSFGDLKG